MASNPSFRSLGCVNTGVILLVQKPPTLGRVLRPKNPLYRVDIRAARVSLPWCLRVPSYKDERAFAARALANSGIDYEGQVRGLLGLVDKVFLELFVAVALNLACASVRVVLYATLVTVNSGIDKL